MTSQQRLYLVVFFVDHWTMFASVEGPGVLQQQSLPCLPESDWISLHLAFRQSEHTHFASACGYPGPPFFVGGPKKSPAFFVASASFIYIMGDKGWRDVFWTSFLVNELTWQLLLLDSKDTLRAKCWVVAFSWVRQSNMAIPRNYLWEYDWIPRVSDIDVQCSTVWKNNAFIAFSQHLSKQLNQLAVSPQPGRCQWCLADDVGALFLAPSREHTPRFEKTPFRIRSYDWIPKTLPTQKETYLSRYLDKIFQILKNTTTHTVTQRTPPKSCPPHGCRNLAEVFQYEALKGILGQVPEWDSVGSVRKSSPRHPVTPKLRRYDWTPKTHLKHSNWGGIWMSRVTAYMSFSWICFCLDAWEKV